MSGQGDGPSEGELEELRRRSGVRLGSDGAFTYRGRPVENERVQELFHRGIDVRADGQVTLTVGRFMAYPEVEGVARFVRRVSWGDGAGRAELVGGHGVGLGAAVIAYAPDDRFYIWFDGLRGPACALRDAHQALAGRIAEDPDGVGGEVLVLTEIPSANAPAPRSPRSRGAR